MRPGLKVALNRRADKCGRNNRAKCRDYRQDHRRHARTGCLDGAIAAADLHKVRRDHTKAHDGQNQHKHPRADLFQTES